MNLTGYATYTIYYKHYTQHYWRKIKKVYADGIIPKKDMPHRWFLTIKGVRTEVPIDGMVFKYSKERELAQRQQLQQKQMSMSNLRQKTNPPIPPSNIPPGGTPTVKEPQVQDGITME